jgi:hypothetical protein
MKNIIINKTKSFIGRNTSDHACLKSGPWVKIAVGGANIQIVHYFEYSYLEDEKSMIHSFTVTFGAKY